MTRPLDGAGADAHIASEYRAAFDASMDMMHVVDRDLTLIIANTAFCSYLAQAGIVLDPVGRSLREVCPFLDEHVFSQYEQVFRSGEAIASQEGTEVDGVTFWTDTRKLPIVSDGAVVRTLTIMRDVTASRQSEETLRQKNQALNAILLSFPVGIALIKDGSIQWSNDTLCRLLGREPGTLEGPVPADLYPSEAERLRVERLMTEEVARLGTLESDVQIVRADGDLRECQASATLLDPAAPEAGVIVVVVDITERKRTEAALRQSERRFRETADLLPDMIYEADLGLNLHYANQSCLAAFGYTQDDLHRGANIRDLMTPADVVRAEQALRQIAAVGGPSFGIYDLRAKDGSTTRCEIHTTTMRDEDGNTIGFRGVLRDISEREKVEQAQRMAAIGQLAAGVAHEFNNILAIIDGRAHLAAESATPEAYEKLVETALRGTARGADVVRNLMNFVRPEEPNRAPTAMEDTIDAALSLAAREIHNSDIIVLKDYASAGRLVAADEGQLQEVFLNLIINACHAMPGGGTLTAATRVVAGPRGREQVVATITDTGVGIAPQAMGRVFEPFFTTKGRLGDADVAGTGLGLSVSHGILRAHGGTIAVESQPGRGASFAITLDVTTETSRPMERVGAAAEARFACGATGCRVLVAEDEEDLRGILQEALSTAGFQVTIAATTDDALAAVEGAPYDLIVSDLLMPGGGARRLLETLSGRLSAPPLIVITGRADEHAVRELLTGGAAAVLPKPFRFAELVDLIRETLAR